MNLENLLKYQKADLEYKKLHDEIVGNPDYKKMKALKEEFNSAKQQVSDSEALAETVIGSYNSALECLAKNAERTERLCARLSEENLDENEEKEIVAELESLRATFAEWEKKAAQLKSNADKALLEYATAQKNGKSTRAAYSDAKRKYESFKAAKEDELGKLKAKCGELESSVESELMNLYKTITAENRYPAFVSVLGDDNSPVCGACGMMLADTAKTEIKNNGMCRCETCRRMIYKL